MTTWFHQWVRKTQHSPVFFFISLLNFLALAWASTELKLLDAVQEGSWPSIWLPAGLSLLFINLFGKKAVLPVFIGNALSLSIIIPSEQTALFSEITSIGMLAFLQTTQAFITQRVCSVLKVNPDFLSDSFSFLASFAVLSLVLTLEGLAILALSPAHFFISGSFFSDSLPEQVVHFALSNMLGILVITYPAQCLFYFKSKSAEHAPLEFCLWFSSMLLASYATALINYDFITLFIPLLTWASTRFDRRFMAYGIFSFMLMIIVSISHSNLANSTLLKHTLETFQWIAVSALISALYIHLLIRVRDQVEVRLEDKVVERTQQLQSINQELRDEVYIRQQAEKSFRSSARQYRALIETAGSPIVVMDKKFVIQKWNSASEALFGYSRDEIVGKNYVDCFVPDKWQDETAWKITKVIESGVSMQNIESETISYDGTTHTMLWNINRLADTEDETNQVIIVGQDITEIKSSQDQLHYLAHYDVLTDTANRRLFEDRCNQALQSVKRHNHHLAIINLDIDHFKRINDTLGHDAGDELLVELTQRIKQCVRKEDTVCRMGGDEFAVLLANISSPEGAQVVAKNILTSFSHPIKVHGGELVITCSIGLTLSPSDGSHYSELLKNADMAMYRAKNAGRNNIQNYCVEMNEALQFQVNLEKDLRTAFKENQFVLFYQPIINLDDGKVVGLESLLRWQHPTKGLIYPSDFLDVAEQTGLLLALGEWTFHNACLQGKAAMAMSESPIQVTVNLSSRQFSHPELIERLAKILKETRFPPQNLIIEITEDTIIHHIDLSPETLRKLKTLGVELLLDSFGTGLSSLSKLRDLPIDIIKIDRLFIQGIPDNKSDIILTETLLNIAQQLELKTIAAGVETEAQAQLLRKNGCRFVQGHLYSKALPSDDIPKLFKALREGAHMSDTDQFHLPFLDSQRVPEN